MSNKLLSFEMDNTFSQKSKLSLCCFFAFLNIGFLSFQINLIILSHSTTVMNISICFIPHFMIIMLVILFDLVLSYEIKLLENKMEWTFESTH